jgi:filamentous hemagglutinin
LIAGSGSAYRKAGEKVVEGVGAIAVITRKGKKVADKTDDAIEAGKEAADAAKGRTKKATVSRSRHPETASHIDDAQAAGHPSELTLDRPGAPGRRADAQAGHDRVPGKQLDEYPPAVFKEGGTGASVRPVSPGDNMGAGASIGNQLRGVPDGTKVIIEVVD